MARKIKPAVEGMKDGTEYLHTKTEGRAGYWMQLYSGRKFYPLDPRPEDINIIDIAHHLSRIDRYNGAGLRYLSVAEHSVWVSRLVSPRNAMWGLLHDAPEFALGDLIRPLKKAAGFEAYKGYEDRLMAVICQRFNLPPVMPEEVARADTRIVDDERRDNLANMEVQPGVWGNALEGFGVNLTRRCEWWQAKQMFLDRFAELGGVVC